MTHLPMVDLDSSPYWEAARGGVMLIRRCGACGHAHHYPRPFCPVCWSEDVSWERASGYGVVYSFSIVRSNNLQPFAARVPYVPAVVELDEGPRVMTEVVVDDVASVRIGQRVLVQFRPEGPDFAVPVFAPTTA